MAARADELSLVTTSQNADWTFDYYADANVIKANITSPIVINNDNTSLITISGENPSPSYLYKAAPPLPTEQAILTFMSGSAQVSVSETANGYVTTASAVIQGLSIEGILKADVVMGTIQTVYPVGNAVPSVNFVGSYFQNLLINGQVLTVNENTAIFGPKPANDGSYFNDPAVLSAMAQQYYSTWGNPNLPASARLPSNWTPTAAVADNVLQCSLVIGVTGVQAPGTTYGNIIVIPGFGTVSLGNIKLTRTPNTDSPDGYTYMFSLEMICAELQGQAKGRVRVIALDTNGGGSGGSPHPTPPPEKRKQPAQ